MNVYKQIKWHSFDFFVLENNVTDNRGKGGTKNEVNLHVEREISFSVRSSAITY